MTAGVKRAPQWITAAPPVLDAPPADAVAGPPEVRALCRILPDDFAIVDPSEADANDGIRRGRCIEATRLAVGVMARLGIAARPMACDIAAINAVALPLVKAGAPASTWPPDAWSTGTSCDAYRSGANRSEPYRRGAGFAGHVVVVGNDWFCDLTVEQYHRPHIGIRIPGVIIGPYGGDGGVVIPLAGGGELVWWWRPEFRSYRTTPAWRQDVDYRLTTALAERVRAALLGAE